MLSPARYLILFLFFFGCSQTNKVTVPYVSSGILVDGTLSNWPQQSLTAQTTDEFDYYTAYDDEFFYVYLVFRNNRFYQNIMRYGLTVYFDSDKKFRRSFGITYPTGILNELSVIPGARIAYLQNAGWSADPDNQRILSQIERDMGTKALIMQRPNKKADIRPGMVSIPQLNAQGIELAVDKSGRLMNVEMKVPIQSTRNRQFAIDPEPDKPFFIGFEVVPPSTEELTGEPAQSMSPAYGGTDRVGRGYGRDPYGRQQMQDDELTQRLRAQLTGEYRRWVRVSLKK